MGHGKRFKVGQLVIYPGHGMGEVKSITNRNILSGSGSFYDVTILSNGMRITIPIETSGEAGLRAIASKSEARKALKFVMEGRAAASNETWARRYRIHMEQIKSGSLLGIAAVVLGLGALRANQELSFGERKLLDLASSMFAAEVCAVLELDRVVLFGYLHSDRTDVREIVQLASALGGR